MTALVPEGWAVPALGAAVGLGLTGLTVALLPGSRLGPNGKRNGPPATGRRSAARHGSDAGVGGHARSVY